MIEIKNVTKSFNQVDALKNVNLQLPLGKQYAICGASGSGKSTLMYLLGGLDTATQGEIIVDNMNLQKMNDEELAAYRNRYVGFVFQFHFLLPSMNCLNNMLLPSRIGGHYSKEIKNRVLELAKVLGVEHCLKKYPFQLSGGEQQRINIIRALSMKPHLLLCDEPTGNLDSENTMRVTSLLKDLTTELGSTLIIVTHDNNVASAIPNRIFIKDGQIN